MNEWTTNVWKQSVQNRYERKKNEINEQSKYLLYKEEFRHLHKWPTVVR